MSESEFSGSLIPFRIPSSEELKEMGRSRPYKNFINFPIDISISGLIRQIIQDKKDYIKYGDLFCEVVLPQKYPIALSGEFNA